MMLIRFVSGTSNAAMLRLNTAAPSDHLCIPKTIAAHTGRITTSEKHTVLAAILASISLTFITAQPLAINGGWTGSRNN